MNEKQQCFHKKLYEFFSYNQQHVIYVLSHEKAFIVNTISNKSSYLQRITQHKYGAMILTNLNNSFRSR